jgi:2-alkyl-3-oxoalkanoate reductase
VRVLVVGATGVLGRHVIPRLVERGHTVHALVRVPAAAGYFETMGVRVHGGDLFDVEALRAAAAGCDAALHLATAIPRRAPFDWTRNDEIRREGTRLLLAAAQEAAVRRYVQQSITFIYGDRGQTIVDETADLRPDPVTESAVDMEAMVRAASMEWSILRGGSFYGPGTGMDDGWRADARYGHLRLPADGGALISLVHVSDMAQAVVLATERASSGTIVNIVDDEPVAHTELYAFVAAQERAPLPPEGGPGVRSLGCSNRAAKAAIGWAPHYSSYRAGLA